jgi:hypothetical protein
VWGKLTQSVVIAAGLLLAACSGGEERVSRPARRPEAPVTTTTVAPPTIDLSRPVPGGSLHGTPRPPLENTGTDYVAITKSLIAGLRWLSENPSPALVADFYVPGTRGHDLRRDAYEFLATYSYRWADEGYQLLSVQVLDVGEGFASVRVTERLEYERLLDVSGAQVGQLRRHEAPMTFDFLLAQDDGRWRIAGGGPVDDEIDL